jgi:hypothetical protein
MVRSSASVGRWLGVAVSVALSAACTSLAARTLEGNPGNARKLVATLKAGDTLNLAAGNYTAGLRLTGLRGSPEAWITIQGPQSGPQAVFVGRPGSNTIGIKSCCYVAIKHLTLDGKGLADIDAIKASTIDDKSPAPTHHITVEGCTIKDHGGSQNTVGISTKTTTWGWVIRNNRIINAGTGLYLGNSDGHRPFVNGLIENNLVMNPVGYCMQIKYQHNRPAIEGMPMGPCTTIIRNNVFIKDDKRSPAGNRPNLLVGNFPDAGAGSQDRYEIYGNFLLHNPRESLLQVAGGVTIHDNVFVDVEGAAIRVQVNRGHKVKHTSIYNNTIYSAGTGVSIGDGAKVEELFNNLILAGKETRGAPALKKGNVFDAPANASGYVKAPGIEPGKMDFYPLPGKCRTVALDVSLFEKDTEYNRDFNGTPKGAFTYVGAYAGEGENPGWRLGADIKPAKP